MDDSFFDREARLAANYALCGQLLHEADRDCWLACLFAPREARPHLHAIYAFACEIGSVRDKVNERLLGEMRLRWWLDALEQPEATGARAHPVADALLNTIERCEIDRTEAVRLIEARSFELSDEPMESLESLEAYAASVSTPMRWSAQIIGRSGDVNEMEALERAGVALTLTRLLASLPKWIAQGRMIVPAALIQRHGAGEDDVRNAAVTPAVRSALAELRARARHHYEEARRRARVLKPPQPALLPAALVPLYLSAMEKPDHHPFRTPVEPARWRRQWRLWRAARSCGL